MITAKEAKYYAGILPVYEGNPLVECLPRLYTCRPEAIQQSLEKTTFNLHQESTRRQKIQWLIDLSLEMFVCSKRHIELQEFIDAVIRHGYLKRSPLTQEDLDFMEDLRKTDAGGNINLQETAASPCNQTKEEQGPEGDIPQTYDDGYQFGVSIALIGCSGAGKSRSVQKILSLYPKVFRHSRLRRDPIYQIVHLTFECPQSGGIKAVCLAILSEIDKVLIDLKLIEPDRGYAVLLKDHSTYKIKSEVCRLLALYSVGILVIDEIQNIIDSGTEKKMLLNFFTSLSNTLGVPMLYIGTPRALSLLTSDVRIARRFGSVALIYWDRFKHDTPLWENFIARLNKFNVVGGTGELSAEVKETLYSCTQGITDLIIKLFILSQMRALICQCKELDKEIIKTTYDEYFMNVHPLIEALRKGDAATIASYQDLGIGSSEFRRMMTKIEDGAYSGSFIPEEELAKDSMRRQIVDAVKSLNDGMCGANMENLIDMVMRNDHISPATIEQTANKIIAMAKIWEQDRIEMQPQDEHLEPKLDPGQLIGG